MLTTCALYSAAINSRIYSRWSEALHGVAGSPGVTFGGKVGTKKKRLPGLANLSYMVQIVCTLNHETASDLSWNEVGKTGGMNPMM